MAKHAISSASPVTAPIATSSGQLARVPNVARATSTPGRTTPRDQYAAYRTMSAAGVPACSSTTVARPRANSQGSARAPAWRVRFRDNEPAGCELCSPSACWTLPGPNHSRAASRTWRLRNASPLIDHELHGFVFVLRRNPPTCASHDEHPLLRGVHGTGQGHVRTVVVAAEVPADRRDRGWLPR